VWTIRTPVAVAQCKAVKIRSRITSTVPTPAMLTSFNVLTACLPRRVTLTQIQSERDTQQGASLRCLHCLLMAPRSNPAMASDAMA
jgi:hypothetical protein